MSSSFSSIAPKYLATDSNILIAPSINENKRRLRRAIKRKGSDWVGNTRAKNIWLADSVVS